MNADKFKYSTENEFKVSESELPASLQKRRSTAQFLFVFSQAFCTLDCS